jgi:hypothetical protein
MAEARFRLAACGVCRVDDRMLLAHYVSPRATGPGSRVHDADVGIPGGVEVHRMAVF